MSETEEAESRVAAGDVLLPESNYHIFQPESAIYHQSLCQKLKRSPKFKNTQNVLTFDKSFNTLAFPVSNVKGKRMKRRRFAITGISDALTETFMKITDEQLQQLGIVKGASNPITKETRQQLDKMIKRTSKQITTPGGSPTNTIVGASSLGLQCSFLGCVGNDKGGYDFISSMKDSRVSTYVSIKQGSSAVCYALVTPDGERTFGLDFGVSKQLQPEEIFTFLIKDTYMLHFSAYELRGDTPMAQATMHAFRTAKHYGTKISLDMGDAMLIESNFEPIINLMRQGVDIVFANEQEADSFVMKHREMVQQYLEEQKIESQDSKIDNSSYEDRSTIINGFDDIKTPDTSNSTLQESSINSHFPNTNDSGIQKQGNLNQQSQYNGPNIINSPTYKSINICTPQTPIERSQNSSSKNSSGMTSEEILDKYSVFLLYCNVLVVKVAEKGAICLVVTERKGSFPASFDQSQQQGQFQSSQDRKGSFTSLSPTEWSLYSDTSSQQSEKSQLVENEGSPMGSPYQQAQHSLQSDVIVDNSSQFNDLTSPQIDVSDDNIFSKDSQNSQSNNDTIKILNPSPIKSKTAYLTTFTPPASPDVIEAYSHHQTVDISKTSEPSHQQQQQLQSISYDTNIEPHLFQKRENSDNINDKSYLINQPGACNTPPYPKRGITNEPQNNTVEYDGRNSGVTKQFIHLMNHVPSAPLPPVLPSPLIVQNQQSKQNITQYPIHQIKAPSPITSPYVDTNINNKQSQTIQPTSKEHNSPIIQQQDTHSHSPYSFPIILTTSSQSPKYNSDTRLQNAMTVSVYQAAGYGVPHIEDASGAGDNFQAGFLYGLFRGHNVQVSMQIGNYLASRVICRRGSQCQVRIENIEYMI
ncbi:MAG: putative adenosine kinase [Streblomastix strix]|uniref:Putative adenosine kinase n=1 Tax=Streblomastix strix TaxID=222440 RepID=A0A5J4WJY8_9EUKA|nr:MAG: putative adenosine kinase [Streblomastix strix]